MSTIIRAPSISSEYNSSMQTVPEGGRECRPSAGHSTPQCPQCRPVSAYGRALRAPVPPVPASAGLRPALRAPSGSADQCRPCFRVPMPRVTECTCRPVPHCRCRPGGLHQAIVTYRVYVGSERNLYNYTRFLCRYINQTGDERRFLALLNSTNF